MSTLVDSPSFTANEVYELQQSDQVQGQAVGAAFGGIGNDNEPHQQLANRTAFLKGRQDTNIANIGSLQSFVALFTGLMGPNGYLKIPYNDVSKGLIELIIQWGVIVVAGQANSAIVNALLTQNFPIAFPNACQRLLPYWETNMTSGFGAFPGNGGVPQAVVPLSRIVAQIFCDSWADGLDHFGL